jgi:hypothetical protein
MDHERYSHWVKSSFALARFDQFMVPLIQQLGRIDCQLIAEDHCFSQSSQDRRATIGESLKLTDRHTLSHLWVLGAYELVRTLDQRAQEQPTVVSSELRERIRDTKHLFARLRMPLAKMEPSRAHRATDFRIAYPMLHDELGISWQVAPDIFISRRELSDALLSLVKEMHTADNELSHLESDDAA